jgi:hypothetical protein
MVCGKKQKIAAGLLTIPAFFAMMGYARRG